MDSQKFDAKIIHKDAESITAFCLSNSTETTVAAATHKEIVEIDISSLLKPPVWVDDDSDDESEDG